MVHWTCYKCKWDSIWIFFCHMHYFDTYMWYTDNSAHFFHFEIWVHSTVKLSQGHGRIRYEEWSMSWWMYMINSLLTSNLFVFFSITCKFAWDSLIHSCCICDCYHSDKAFKSHFNKLNFHSKLRIRYSTPIYWAKDTPTIWLTTTI